MNTENTTDNIIATLDANTDLTILLPGRKAGRRSPHWELGEEILIGLDFFGEKEARFQTLHFDAGGEEVRVYVRYDADGKIAEVMVAPGILVTRTDDMTVSAWMLERDDQ